MLKAMSAKTWSFSSSDSNTEIMYFQSNQKPEGPFSLSDDSNFYGIL